MATFDSASSTGDSTTSSSTPQTKVTLNIASPSSKSYIIFFSVDGTVSNTGTRCKIDLEVDGVTVATFSPRTHSTSERHNVFFFEQVTGKSSAFDCIIKYSSTDGSNNVTVNNARVVAWRYDHISDLDLQYDGDDTGRSLPSAYDDNGARVSFTPSSTGNYFIFGSGGVAPGSTTVSALCRMTADGTSYPLATDTTGHWCREAPAAVTDAFYCFSTAIRQSLSTGGSRVLEVEASNESGTTGTWKHTRVLAFREDAFTDADYASADTASAHSQGNSYSTRATNTTAAPSEATDYLILAGMTHGHLDTTKDRVGDGRIQVASTEVQLTGHRPKEQISPGCYLSIGHASVRNDSAAFTVDTAHKTNNAFDNEEAKNSWVIVLRDDFPEPVAGGQPMAKRWGGSPYSGLRSPGLAVARW